MNDMIVKSVDLMGDTVMAAKDKEGVIWVGVSYICNALGMSKGQKDKQVQKVQKDEVLKRGCFQLEAGVLDVANEVISLRIDFIPIWLSKVSITDKTKQENPELAEKLLKYQLRAKDILAEAFMPKQTFPQTLQEQIQAIAQGETELYQRMGTLEDRFTRFEDSLPFLPEDADEVRIALNKRVVDFLGGKDSNAYRNRGLRGKVYIDAYRELKRNFDVTTYKSIKRNQKERALQTIAEYKPPLVLLDEIQAANKQ